MSGSKEALEWANYAEEDWLSGYAVHTRYPGNQPALEEAKEALQITMAIRRYARKFLGLRK